MKKTMALVLAVVLLLTMSVPTLAFELDSVETAVEFAEPLAEEESAQSQGRCRSGSNGNSGSGNKYCNRNQ